MDKSKLIKLLIAIAITLFVWCIPGDWLGIDGLTIIGQRVLAIFVFAALMWIFEAIPIWTTSVLIMVLMLLTVSNNQLIFLDHSEELGDAFGTVINYKSIMASFADPVVMLFLGGFALAIGATKCGLDVNLARVMLKPFGTRSEIVLLGFMIITAVFSMFMSNTATAAMMLTILAPVMRQLPQDGKGRIGLALCIPIAANIGGIGTPIGTPPNAIAKKYIEESVEANIGFGEWMLVFVPFVIIMLAIAWFLLIKMFPFSKKNLDFKIDGKFRTDREAIVVYVTFAVTILLWLADKATGLNSNIVAMIPLAVFAVTGVIGVSELKSLSWDVIWLVAGGFALGVGLSGSGLEKALVASIPFDQMPPFVTLVGAGVLCCFMSTFMSNSATTSLLVPILAVVASSMPDLADYGGVITMLIGVAVSASLAMALPISTPPNALAYSTGVIKQGDMARVGIIIGIIGIIIGYAVIIAATKLGMIGG